MWCKGCSSWVKCLWVQFSVLQNQIQLNTNNANFYHYTSLTSLCKFEKNKYKILRSSIIWLNFQTMCENTQTEIISEGGTKGISSKG